MLKDGFGRKVNYLRVSVTERCNFRCQYCMPEKPFSWVPQENLLSFEDMFEFIKVGIDEGIDKVRLTGGEPLLRKGLDTFIKMIADYSPTLDLALTTNAFLLEEAAQKLKDAGLKRVNISLDSLKPEVAHQIAQKNVLEKVLRFIEYMENSHANVKAGLTSQDIQDIVQKEHPFTKGERVGNSPSQDYFLEDGYKFGIIEPHLDDFCNDCNRLRITAEGYLIPCLYFEDALSIADAIKSKNIEEASTILKKVLQNKPEKNKWGSDNDSERAFYETGG